MRRTDSFFARSPSCRSASLCSSTTTSRAATTSAASAGPPRRADAASGFLGERERLFALEGGDRVGIRRLFALEGGDRVGIRLGIAAGYSPWTNIQRAEEPDDGARNHRNHDRSHIWILLGLLPVLK